MLDGRLFRQLMKVLGLVPIKPGKKIKDKGRSVDYVIIDEFADDAKIQAYLEMIKMKTDRWTRTDVSKGK